MPGRERTLLLLILLLALSLRLAGGLVVSRQLAAKPGAEAKFLFPDSCQFDECARNLLHRGEYVDDYRRHAWRTPAYSVLLAAVYAVAGENPWAARLMTNLLDVFNVWLVYLLAARVFDRRAGLLAAGMAAVYPFFVYFSNLVLADSLGLTAVLLTTLAFHGWVKAQAAPAGARWRWPTLAGLALAFAIMVKAAFALLGLFFAGFMLLRLRRIDARPGAACPRRATLSGLAMMAFAFALGMAPWWVRNYLIFERFVPGSTMGGFTLYESNSEHADGGPNHGKTPLPKICRLVLEHMREGKCEPKMTALAKTTLAEIASLYAFMIEPPATGLLPMAWLRLKMWVFNCQPAIYFSGLSISYQSSEDEEMECDVADMNEFDIALDSDEILSILPQLPIENLLNLKSNTESRLLGPPAFGELYNDILLKHLSLIWIAYYPDRFLKLVPVRIKRTWNLWPNYAGASAWYYKAASLASYLPVMLLAIGGLVAFRRRWREVHLLAVPAVYILCLHAVFMGSVRYRLPAMGCLIVLAAGTAIRIYDACRRKGIDAADARA